jgi:glycosyltransferase involved in cell wall biosynthesis
MTIASKVFVSYSWDDEAHKSWVRHLATRLRSDGVDVTLDQWHAVPGDQLPEFMEKAVRESNFVLIICTPNYRLKSDARLGGVGYEGDIMTGEVLTNRNQRKFVPILRSGEWASASPSWLKSKFYIDLSGSPLSESSYCDLLKVLLYKWPSPPPLGPQPDIAPSDPSTLTVATQLDSMTIIVPVYNEVHILRDLLRALRSEGLLDKYKVILCDDGSTDNSFAAMQECCSGIPNLKCIQNRFNTRKVGAIDRMARLVRTPFVLTLDADCSLSELKEDALEKLMARMSTEDVSASCFRIVPNDRDWLGRLQKLDYSIFTDALRRILGVPVCLIGQGVLWKTDSLLKVLSQHSGEFFGDDLENTIIALDYKMKIYWERESIILMTNPKRTVMDLLKQRALSWDFGMLRVLFGKRALRLGGESGAFYKNVLLLDVIAHPFRLMAVPMLLSVPLVNFLGLVFYNGAAYDLYRNSLAFSLKYGASGIVSIWVISTVNSFACVRSLWPTVKWAMFNAVYLSSPFVYVLFYPLLSSSNVNVYDTLGAAMHWLGLGLLITYLWWAALTLCLLCITSLERKVKTELIWSVPLAPFYYFILFTVCKTVGMLKFLSRYLLTR